MAILFLSTIRAKNIFGEIVTNASEEALDTKIIESQSLTILEIAAGSPESLERLKKTKESCLTQLAEAKTCVYLHPINNGTRTLVQSVCK